MENDDVNRTTEPYGHSLQSEPVKSKAPLEGAGRDLDGDEEWEDDLEESERLRQVDRRNTRRKRTLTGALALLAVLGLGFASGVYYQKHEGTAGGSTGTAASSLAREFGGSGTAGSGSKSTGSHRFPGAGALKGTGAVAGTVVSETAGTLYVSEGSTSALVKVETNPSSTVTSPSTTSVASIHPGDTVTIQGAKQKDGTFMAGSITDSGTGAASLGGFTFPGG